MRGPPGTGPSNGPKQPVNEWHGGSLGGDKLQSAPDLSCAVRARPPPHTPPQPLSLVSKKKGPAGHQAGGSLQHRL